MSATQALFALSLAAIAAPALAGGGEPGSPGLELKFRGLLQGDGRFWLGDSRFPQDDTFLLRRAEPTIEGTWGNLVGFRINAQLAGDNVTVNDAYIDIKLDHRATLRIGKAKVPVGLERLQSNATTQQAELGFPSELAPGRDIGVQLQGEFDSRASYAVGVFNGTPDGRDGSTSNADDNFELVARAFIEPWKKKGGLLSGLGLGLAASYGEKQGGGSEFLPRYRTPGQVQFFGYRTDVQADGRHVRWSPQAWFYLGRFGVLGEYISSRQALLLPATGQRTRLDNDAWQLAGSWVLTGERAGYRGVGRPDQPFTIGGPGWGALELVARYGRLDIDANAFPAFADPGHSSAGARGLGVGLNWYLTEHLKLVADYTRTTFDAAAGSTARETEQVIFTRAQFSF